MKVESHNTDLLNLRELDESLFVFQSLFLNIRWTELIHFDEIGFLHFLTRKRALHIYCVFVRRFCSTNKSVRTKSDEHELHTHFSFI
jgi:hypothetical protein